MLALNPERVSFLAVPLGGVVSVQLDERADRPVVEHDEAGPFASFVDTPRRVVTVRVVQRVPGGALIGPRVGQTGVLSVVTAPGGVASGGVGRVRVSMTAVVVAVSHRAGASSERGGSAAERVLDLIAVSGSGDESPLTSVVL